jgi:hypothetical protein
MKKSPGWLKQNICLKIKNASQKILTYLSVTHVFIKQIFRAVELAPPFPLPLTGLCRGWGSSGSFQPQAAALVMAMKQ